MERESFESDSTAKVMNERFVNIKVDREEHPGVDDIYMTAVQMLTGHGGWPMSVFLEPLELRPYWGGTYFPPTDRHGLPGFTRALEGMSEAWKDRRDDVLKQATGIAAAVRERLEADTTAVHIGRPQVSMAVQTLLTIFDRVHGGFSDAPKFPQPVYLELLLDVREKHADAAGREQIDGVIRQTLDKMALGGMFDQVGGGFHRYSVDRYWLVPHFEKMLYDQGQLLSVYARAARVYGDAFYARTAQRIAGYVLGEMTAAEGAFYTAQDAEVDGKEGLNYLWIPDQIEAVLGATDAAFAAGLYGTDVGPNFKDPHHPDEPERSVLRLADRPDKLAAGMGTTTEALLARIDECNRRLVEARKHRKQPRLDDKIVTAWNGLMIAGLAVAARELKRTAPELADSYARAALRAARWVSRNMQGVDGGLLRSVRAGTGHGHPGAIPAVLEDYASLALAMSELAHASTNEDREWCVTQASQLIADARRRFGDGRGGFFDTQQSESDLFVRARTTYDGAMPCGSSVMAVAQLRLGAASGERRYFAESSVVLASISNAIAESPIATANATRALLGVLNGHEQVLVEALIAAGAKQLPTGATPSAAGAIGKPAVEVYASEPAIEVGPEHPAELFIQMRIAPGHHINAADPGDSEIAESLMPLQVAVVNGTGIAVYADYPEGEPWGPDRIRVHSGTIEFRLAVEQTGDIAGTPRIAVAFQTCTETACEEPRVVELDVELKPLP